MYKNNHGGVKEPSNQLKSDEGTKLHSSREVEEFKEEEEEKGRIE